MKICSFGACKSAVLEHTQADPDTRKHKHTQHSIRGAHLCAHQNCTMTSICEHAQVHMHTKYPSLKVTLQWLQMPFMQIENKPSSDQNLALNLTCDSKEKRHSSWARASVSPHSCQPANQFTFILVENVTYSPCVRISVWLLYPVLSDWSHFDWKMIKIKLLKSLTGSDSSFASESLPAS